MPHAFRSIFQQLLQLAGGVADFLLKFIHIRLFFAVLCPHPLPSFINQQIKPVITTFSVNQPMKIPVLMADYLQVIREYY
jgi:hypothetical protein